jgi:hypothetical protein
MMQNKVKWALAGAVAAVVVVLLAIAGLWYLNRGGPPASESPVVTVPTSRPDDSAHATADGYVADFTQSTRGWSRSTSSHTPAGNRLFLGQFSHDAVTFKLTKLPAHKMLRIRFSLLALNTLDGSGRITAAGGHAGPDVWSMRMIGGPTLVRATFSNTPDTPNFAWDGKIQSYPSPIPSLSSAHGTGALAVNALGFVYHFNGVQEGFPMDAEYAMDMTIPHDGDGMTLEFQGRGMGDLNDEGWGLSDFKVEPITTEAAAPDASDLHRWLDEVCGKDAVLAHRSFWNLVAGGDATVAFLESDPAQPGFNRQDVMQRLALMKTGTGDAKADAADDLTAMGPGVEPIVAADESAYADPAVLDLLENIELRPILDADSRRSAAKARLLAVINTPKARQAYDAWVGSAPTWTPNWQRRFDTAYHLGDGQHLVYVPPPYIPERERFLTERRNLLAATGITSHYDFNPVEPSAAGGGIILIPAQSTAELQTRAAKIQTADNVEANAAQPPSVLEQVVQQMSRLQRKKAMARVALTPELKALAMPGDWVMAYNGTSDQFMADLGEILDQQMNVHVRFALRDVERQGYDISGTYEFNASATRPAAQSETVLVFSNDDEPIRNTRGITGPATSLLPWIGRQYDTLVKTPKTIAGAPRSIILQIEPSGLPLSGDPHSPENAARLKKVMDNIALQTGLKIIATSLKEKAYVVEPK